MSKKALSFLLQFWNCALSEWWQKHSLLLPRSHIVIFFDTTLVSENVLKRLKLWDGGSSTQIEFNCVKFVYTFLVWFRLCVTSTLWTAFVSYMFKIAAMILSVDMMLLFWSSDVLYCCKRRIYFWGGGAAATGGRRGRGPIFSETERLGLLSCNLLLQLSDNRGHWYSVPLSRNCFFETTCPIYLIRGVTENNRTGRSPTA